MTKKCARCGCEFQINPHQHKKTYCNGCIKIHREELRKEYTSRPEVKKRIAEYSRKRERAKKQGKKIHLRHTVICERCGEEFTASSGSPKVCIECLMMSDNCYERASAKYRKNYDTEEFIRISD